jgi:hypothetical protein
MSASDVAVAMVGSLIPAVVLGHVLMWVIGQVRSGYGR